MSRPCLEREFDSPSVRTKKIKKEDLKRKHRIKHIKDSVEIKKFTDNQILEELKRRKY